MTENLASSAPPPKSLIKDVSVKIVSGYVSRVDFDLITTMVANASSAFDTSIQTTSGRRFKCSVHVHLEEIS